MGLQTTDFKEICATPFQKLGDFEDPEEYR